jgi:hypothetical protein
VLTERGKDVLVQIERLMDEASHAMAVAGQNVSELPADKDGAARSEAFASATSGSSPGAVRGN